MYYAGALTDVMLSASGTVLRAHRIVLASCSQYFAQLFKEVEPGASTLVVVLGCEAVELKLLLSFMYTGEVTASRKALPALLRLAKTLKVAGLTDADCTNPSPSETEKKESDPPPSPLDPPETQEYKNEDISNTIDNIHEDVKFFETGNTENENCESIDYSRTDERLSKLDQIVKNLYSTHKLDSPPVSVPVDAPINNNLEEPTEGPFERKWRHGSVCNICNKRLSNQYNLRVHMETHAGGRHACRACNHVSRSRDALRKHVAYRHPHVAGLRGVIGRRD